LFRILSKLVKYRRLLWSYLGSHGKD
jgi:hypothetical protein